ncbi:hypothetical protein BBO99_00006841 [Phytophthora kernoviae]|uniref:Uncharacterized protein n=2 Tax=Phytophthora kernoviae TaxID=325452 RepID=A0A3R7G959_9STRA|nr:hypothetical protein G195_009230 [Phytophthora kernoviae 00238/432]KAG2529281.1 hypothetical protein JM16_001859 [Phytophthora kernoviae]KAG2530431.1 hypothetical protein JM18_002284 [Phytophthora kernoviae]RLN43659.1 hypothetical protein BBI17_006823 [Phytophthora kernoviae]RLN77324.1 hypothetical protein BBO99_00006841 [Phytophthora kernoviae]
MVVFHVKRGDRSEFLFQANITTNNDDLIRTLCRIQNLRLRLAALADALDGLGRYGMAKPPQEQGLDAYQEGTDSKQRGEFYEADPTGHRTGEGVSPQLRDVLSRVSTDAKTLLDSKLQVARRVYLEESELLEKLQNVRGAVAMAFPMGLPDFDPVKLMLDADSAEEALADSSAVLEVLPEDSAELWWAGKQFFRDQHVHDLAGKNEKSTLIVKLQKKGGGAPSREPGVSEDERKAMMAFYFKKQQEMQQAADDDAEDYMTSTWADPKALKNSLRVNLVIDRSKLIRVLHSCC